MSLRHEFFRIPNAVLPTDNDQVDPFLMDFYLTYRAQGVWIHDNYILPNLRKFEAVTTLHNGTMARPGLNYYGMTLLPPDRLPEFIAILETIPKSHHAQCLCRQALVAGDYILHWGI